MAGWALLKTLSLAYLLACSGMTLAAAVWWMLRPRVAPWQRAELGFGVALGGLAINIAVAVLIWAGVVSHHIRMTTGLFTSLMHGGWSLAITGGGLTVLAVSLALGWGDWQRGRNHQRETRRRPLGERDGLRIVESPAVSTAGLVGALRPELWVNPQYWAGLSAAQQELVVHHERLHLQRRDNLRKLVLSWLAALHGVLPWLRRWPALYELDCELAVDDACRRELDEGAYRALVAQAAQFSLPRSARAVASGISEAALRLRLEALLSERRAGGRWLAGSALALALAASALPGLGLLQSATLRCLLACYLGY
jgi:hypothetical protein